MCLLRGVRFEECPCHRWCCRLELFDIGTTQRELVWGSGFGFKAPKCLGLVFRVDTGFRDLGYDPGPWPRWSWLCS